MSWDLGGDNLSDEFGVSREDVPFPPPRFFVVSNLFCRKESFASSAFSRGDCVLDFFAAAS